MRLRSSGFTLLEILVALLILTVGLLGFAGLQLSALSSSRDSTIRSQALALAGDFADRVRGNRDYTQYDQRITLTAPAAWATQDGNLYGAADAAGNPVWTALACAAVPAPANCEAAACTPRQQAAVDVYQACLAAQQLPGAAPGIETRCSDPAGRPAKKNPYAGASIGTPHPWRNPGVLPAQAPGGNDGDRCSPGSRLEIRVSWQRQAGRTGAGEGSYAGNAALALGGCAAGRDCVLLEVQP